MRPRPSRSFVVASPESSIVHADEASAWDDLHATFEMKRINHRGSLQQRWRLHEPGRKLYLPVATRGGWSASPYRRASSRPVLPAKWRGAKTCAATPPEPNSMPVAAWHWAIAVTCVGGILAAASPEGGSSSNRLIGDPPEDAVASAMRRELDPRLLRRFKVSLTFHWTRTKLARSAGSSPVSIITALTRSGARISAPALTKRIEHTARRNLLVRTRDQIDGSSSVGSSPAPLREQIDEW